MTIVKPFYYNHDGTLKSVPYLGTLGYLEPIQPMNVTNRGLHNDQLWATAIIVNLAVGKSTFITESMSACHCWAF